MVNLLEQLFPRLAGSGYRITSPSNRDYNCIAWAAGDSLNWWWPGTNPNLEYWPPGVLRDETLDAFRDAFASLGYGICTREDVEPGFEKVALYASSQGFPTHAARQLANGRWTSKLGNLEDIEHVLSDLEGDEYGSVVLILKRPLPSQSPPP
jgi:hypothetical protein